MIPCAGRNDEVTPAGGRGSIRDGIDVTDAGKQHGHFLYGGFWSDLYER